MSSGTKIVGIVVLAGAVIVGSILLGRQDRHKTIEPAAQPESTTSNPAVSTPSNAVAVSRPPVPAVTPTATNAQIQTPPNVTARPGNAGLITDWNEKIDEALKSGAEDRDVAKTLLKSFPKFPAEGQVEAIQHISNLLPDEDYPELAKLMEDDKLPEDVLDQLIMDLLNRPNKIMLPELVKVAKNPQHAKAGEAKDFLELYLEEDYGADWNLWQTKVDEWLKANPDE